MENSKISWCDHTFNPWIGCSKVSPGCANCYAEALMDHRYHRVTWGKGQPRSLTSDDNWKQPGRWSRKAIADGIRPRVFCGSLCDWLDDEVPVEWLARLLCVIVLNPNIDWLLLTKRPQNWRLRMEQVAALKTDDFLISSAPEIAKAWLSGIPHHNAWIGTTVENQEMANIRIPELAAIPARIRFLSCEPLLERVSLFWFKSIHWVIIGGESGGSARPFDIERLYHLLDQCQQQGIPVFVKQLGANPLYNGSPFSITHKAGADISEFPCDLAIQDFPEVET
jgi:protein gp37